LEELKKYEHSANPFEELAKPMRPLFVAFEKFLLKQAGAFESEVRKAAKESIKPKGKYIRPTLVFAAAAGGNCDKNSLVRRGAIVELTHLSTLIHDDVIDGADLRRNSETANKKYGARTAILLGDAIFSHTMILTSEEDDPEVSRRIAECVRTICEGEIRQTLADKGRNVSRKRYYEIAFGKTGALFALACAVGAMALKPENNWVKDAEEVGKQLGIAYQIYDDICDWFMTEEDAGKTLGTDLISGKQTFPLIVLMEKLPKRAAEALAKNLRLSDPASIAAQMKTLGVLEECSKEFIRRVSAAEKILEKYPQEGAKLLEFCGAMRKLKLG